MFFWDLSSNQSNVGIEFNGMTGFHFFHNSSLTQQVCDEDVLESLDEARRYFCSDTCCRRRSLYDVSLGMPTKHGACIVSKFKQPIRLQAAQSDIPNFRCKFPLCSVEHHAWHREVRYLPQPGQGQDVQRVVVVELLLLWRCWHRRSRKSILRWGGGEHLPPLQVSLGLTMVFFCERGKLNTHDWWRVDWVVFNSALKSAEC